MTDPGSDQFALVRNLRAQNAALQAENSSLKTGGPGGTSGGMDPALVDAKIAASEARTGEKFAKLDGKLDLILEKIETVRAQSTDARTEARTTRRTVVGTGISLAALLLAVFALYSNGFNMGTKVGDVARIEAEQTYNRLAPPAIDSIPTEPTYVEPTNTTKALPAPAR